MKVKLSYSLIFFVFLWGFVQSVSARQVWLIDPATIALCGMDTIESLIQNSDRNPKNTRRYLLSSPGPTPFTTDSIEVNTIKTSADKVNLSTQIEMLHKLNIGQISDIHILTDHGDENSIDFLRGVTRINSAGTALHFYLPSNQMSFVGLNNTNLQQLTVTPVPCGEISSNSAQKPLLQDLRKLISRASGMPELLITPQTDLRKLNIDEMTIFEINAAIDDEFGLMSQPSEYKTELTKVGDMLTYIEEAPRSRGGNSNKLEVMEQTIFYATNRQQDDTSDAFNYYSGERNKLKKLEYGQCTVTIPISHKKGQIESPLFNLKFFQNPKKHIILESIEPLTKERFFSTINGHFDGRNESEFGNDVVMFVHGFNVSFHDAAIRTAQIANDIGFNGIPVLFSWPSDASLLGYTRDREDANWSRTYLENFLEEIIEKSKHKRIHLIAHSMGNQVLIGALYQMALRRGENTEDLFSSIIFAAPDFDAELFSEQIAPEITKLSKNWTIYASDKDAALDISNTVNNAPRLGQPVSPLAGMSVIDATGIEVTPWSVPEFHSYYATKQRVIDDIVSVIKGVPTNLRALTPKQQNDVPYWKLNTEK